MRILHIIPSYLPARLASGPIIPTHTLNGELVKKGIEVIVYTTNLDGVSFLDVPLNQEVIIDGVKVFYFPVTSRLWQYSCGLHHALARNVKDFDLVHITSVFLSASTLGAYYAEKFSKPYIISPHGSLMRESLSRRSFKKQLYILLFEKRNLENASAVHFLVEQEREDYLRAGLFLKKGIVIPNGLDIENLKSQVLSLKSENIFRNQFRIKQDKKVILFLGRLHPIKGLDTLIPAFAKVIKKEPGAVLVLAGPSENNYKETIKSEIGNWKLEIGENVILTDMLVGDDKITALRESDVFILPSYTEAVSMATLEAMYFGLPVIVTKNSGLSSIIKRDGAGLVVEKDVNQVAEAVLKILRNSELAEKMGERGRELVNNEFSGAKVAEKFLKEYNEAIKNYEAPN